MKVYTRTGDAGETSLLSGPRVAKDHARIEACGTVDELSASLGVLRAEPLPDGVCARLAEVQEVLLNIGGALADPEGRLEVDEATWSAEALEQWIDAMEEDLPPLRAFILPGGCRAAALAHVTRTVCRRAERRLQSIAGSGGRVHGGIAGYMNRLSDALFVLARWLNAHLGIADTQWR